MILNCNPARQATMQRDGLAARVRDLESAAAQLRVSAERAVELERLLGEAVAGRDAAEAARARLLHTRDELATSLLVGTCLRSGLLDSVPLLIAVTSGNLSVVLGVSWVRARHAATGILQGDLRVGYDQ